MSNEIRGSDGNLQDWRPVIRALLYPVIFEAQPQVSVDRVVRQVVDKAALGITKPQYQEAIRQALASSEELCQLLPLAANQSEATIRDFLGVLATRLDDNHITGENRR
jgi:hypothetical protein